MPHIEPPLAKLAVGFRRKDGSWQVAVIKHGQTVANVFGATEQEATDTASRFINSYNLQDEVVAALKELLLASDDCIPKQPQERMNAASQCGWNILAKTEIK